MFSELSVGPSCSIFTVFLGNDSTHGPYCRSLYLTSNTQQRYILKTIFWKFKEVQFSSFGVILRYFKKINFLQCSAKPLATAQSRTNFILRLVTFSKEIVSKNLHLLMNIYTVYQHYPQPAHIIKAWDLHNMKTIMIPSCGSTAVGEFWKGISRHIWSRIQNGATVQ